MEPEEVIPLHSEFEAGFQVFVVNLRDALAIEEVEQIQTLCFVVMTRQGGLLLALPELAIAPELLQGGNQPGAQGLIGPSTRLEVAAAALDEDAFAELPQPVGERSIVVLLVDFTTDILSFLKIVESKEELDAAQAFDILEPYLVPLPQDLVARAIAWADGGGEETESRLQFYSAEDVPETPPSAAPKRAARRRTPEAGTGGGNQPKAAPKKRTTVSQLAESLDVLTATLPALTSQLQDLTTRTEMIERGMGTTSRPSALRAPLGPSATVGFAKASSPAELLKAMPPPRSTSSRAASPHVTFSHAEAQEMESEVMSQPGDFAKAMVEQSKALTALVAQIASQAADPLHDLSSSSSGLSSKGSVGRARLQAELAVHKGVFFSNVMQAMSRRMHPAMTAEVELSALRDRGVTATQYLERYGGYGRTRDIGMIIWQVAMVMDHMQMENFQAAKDALSLLFVCLEQTALDGGNMQVGLLLSLTEDPPASLFSARSIATASHPKPFAPTASQKWVTIALQYLKEVDIITTRRQEITATKNQPAKNDADPLPKATPKKKQKGKGKGRGQENQTTQEEEV